MVKVWACSLFVLLMGCKDEPAGGTPATDKKEAATPTFGRAMLTDDQRCYEFEAGAVKSKGWAWAKAAKPDTATLEENVACATDKLIGTCTVDVTKIRYYGGDRTGGAWTAETAAKSCSEVQGTFK